MATQELAKDWQQKVRWADEKERELQQARIGVKNAADRLASSIVPPDGKPGEKFCVWVRFSDIEEKLLEVVKEYTEPFTTGAEGETDEPASHPTVINIRI